MYLRIDDVVAATRINFVYKCGAGNVSHAIHKNNIRKFLWMNKWIGFPATINRCFWVLVLREINYISGKVGVFIFCFYQRARRFGYWNFLFTSPHIRELWRYRISCCDFYGADSAKWWRLIKHWAYQKSLFPFRNAARTLGGLDSAHDVWIFSGALKTTYYFFHDCPNSASVCAARASACW